MRQPASKLFKITDEIGGKAIGEDGKREGELTETGDTQGENLPGEVRPSKSGDKRAPGPLFWGANRVFQEQPVGGASLKLHRGL